MARGPIPITDISIILWNIKTFIQFLLINSKFYASSLYWKPFTELNWEKKLEETLQFPFP